jgi:hypothetical protein
LPTDDAFQNKSSGGVEGTSGLFVAISLPNVLASHLAGHRTILSIDAKDIPDTGLERLENAEVGCLLFGSGVDALDIIAQLGKVGFRGLVTVMAPAMPNPRMVERELRSAGRAMTVRLVVR